MWHHVRGLFQMIYSHLKIPFLINCTSFDSSHENIRTHTVKNQKEKYIIDKYCNLLTWLHDQQVAFEVKDFCQVKENRKYYFESFLQRHHYPRKGNTIHLALLDPFHVSPIMRLSLLYVHPEYDCDIIFNE